MKVDPDAVVDNHGLFLNDMESLLHKRRDGRFHSAAMDSLVPSHTKPVPALANTVISQNLTRETCFGIDFCRSKLSSIGYLPSSVTQNVSSSSLDIGVVPEGTLSSNSADPSLTNTASFASHRTPVMQDGQGSKGVEVQGEEKEPLV